uniref:CCHC-type domain-containing protein n=1 Tax=Chelonoidis abingdonii TaxID=106734 RepID=A0A8C0IPP7_CHEAB
MSSAQGGRLGPGARNCFTCGQKGHFRWECPYWVGAGRPHRDKAPPVKVTGGPPACCVCGKSGHLSRNLDCNNLLRKVKVNNVVS